MICLPALLLLLVLQTSIVNTEETSDILDKLKQSIADFDKDRFYEHFKHPLKPSGCTDKYPKLWKEAADCIQCSFDSCMEQCEKQNKTPPWLSACYRSTNWTILLDSISNCLDGTKTCKRIPASRFLLHSLSAEGRLKQRKKLNSVDIGDVFDFGLCISGAGSCFKKCPLITRDEEENAVADCFKIDQVDQTMKSFLDCIESKIDSRG
uniref:Uncharacterized protein n=1 Tax=Romanomermis culicivorax TaxID=13658 RepID=A0A915KVG2_ROMCU